MIKTFYKKFGLKFLDVLFHVIHLSVIGFFLIGWMIEETRMAHLILCILILISWFGLGIFFGFGYCLITDVQWRIKKKLNQVPSTKYYVKYVIDKVVGLDTNPNIVNRVTTFTFFGIFLASLILIFYNINLDIKIN